jgi:hypothetical protein
MVQITTEHKVAVSEEDRILANTKIILILMKQNGPNIHKRFKVEAFNAKGRK